MNCREKSGPENPVVHLQAAPEDDIISSAILCISLTGDMAASVIRATGAVSIFHLFEQKVSDIIFMLPPLYLVRKGGVSYGVYLVFFGYCYGWCSLPLHHQMVRR